MSTSIERYSGLSDITLLAYEKCCAGELQFVRLKPLLGGEINPEDISAFEVIEDEYIKRFGVGETYLEILRLKKAVANAQSDFILSRKKIMIYVFDGFDEDGNELQRLKQIEVRDKSLLNAVDYHQFQLDDYISKLKPGIDSTKMLIHVSKYFKFPRRANEITALEYFETVKIITNQQTES